MEQSLRHLLSDISHELGTPLTSIQGYMKAMMDGVIAPGHPKYMRMIFEKTMVMDRLIGDLFELSKLEAKQIAFDFQTVAAIPYLSKLYDKYKLDLAGYDYELAFELDAGLDESYTVELDPARMEQVIVNLLNNAKHHTVPGRAIHIEVQLKKDEMTVHILDHGSGMDEAEIPYLFDRFYRGKHSKRNKSKGSGLGLSICKEIITIHGGTIGIHSKLGEGSDVYFAIPVRRS
jgi:signal transduction histidine kinase